MIFPDTKRGADKKKANTQKRNHNSELYNTSNDSISTCIPSKHNTKKKKKKEQNLIYINHTFSSSFILSCHVKFFLSL